MIGFPDGLAENTGTKDKIRERVLSSHQQKANIDVGHAHKIECLFYNSNSLVFGTLNTNPENGVSKQFNWTRTLLSSLVKTIRFTTTM